MNEPNSQPKHLDERLFDRLLFSLPWLAFMMLVLLFVSWPIRNIALVCWVYGSHAYFHDGIRVLPGKPVRFSNGAEAPTLPDLMTGFGAFVVTVFGLTTMLIFMLRIYERHFVRRDDHAT